MGRAKSTTIEGSRLSDADGGSASVCGFDIQTQTRQAAAADGYFA